MPNLHDLLTTDGVYRLGWALLHSLWEGAVVAAVLVVALLILRRRSAGVRYVTACAALGAMSAGPAVTFFVVSPPGAGMRPASVVNSRAKAAAPAETGANPLPPAVVAEPLGGPPVAGSSAPAPTITIARPLSERLSPYLPWLVLGWVIGVSALSLWNLGGWAAAQRLRRLGTRPVGDEMLTRLAELARRMKVTRAVRMFQSILVEVPTVVGWLRPVILVPAAALTDLTPQQLDALLAHELAHIKRHDYLVNLFQLVAETLLFYHPAAWWISRRIRIEREHCCDDAAVGAYSSVTYAKALTLMEAARLGPAVAMGAGGRGGTILSRVRRVLGVGNAENARPSAWLLAGAVVVMLMAMVVTTAGKAAAKPGAFTGGEVHYGHDEKGRWTGERMNIDADQAAELAAFFPHMGEGRKSNIAGAWAATVDITFKRADGTSLRVMSNFEDWSEGSGDWDVKGDLRKKIDEMFFKWDSSLKPGEKTKLHIEQIKKSLANFNFELQFYNGPKGFDLDRSIRLATGESVQWGGAFAIKPEQAGAIVDYLVADSFFDRAQSFNAIKELKADQPTYAMMVAGAGFAPGELMQRGDASARRLEGVAKLLDGPAAQALLTAADQVKNPATAPAAHPAAAELMKHADTLRISLQRSFKPADRHMRVPTVDLDANAKTRLAMPDFTRVPLRDDQAKHIVQYLTVTGFLDHSAAGQHPDKEPDDNGYIMVVYAEGVEARWQSLGWGKMLAQNLAALANFLDGEPKAAVEQIMKDAAAWDAAAPATAPAKVPPVPSPAEAEAARVLSDVVPKAAVEHAAATKILADVPTDRSLRLGEDVKGFTCWTPGMPFIFMGADLRPARIPAALALERSKTLEDWAMRLADEKNPAGPAQAAAAVATAGQYLSHEKPEYRAIACEVVAHFPQAAVAAGLAPKIGALLDDKAFAFDGAKVGMGQRDTFISRIEGGVRVNDVADVALQAMTTFHFSSSAALAAWWKVNQDCTHRLWYWNVRWRNARPVDKAIIARDLAGMKAEEGLRLLLLAGSPPARRAEAELVFEVGDAARLGAGADLVKSSIDYAVVLDAPAVAAYIKENHLEDSVRGILKGKIDWPEPRYDREGPRQLIITLLPILPLIFGPADAALIENELANPKGIVVGPGYPRTELAQIAVKLDPQRAEVMLLAQLRDNPSSDLAADLIRRTGLKHWDVVEATCKSYSDKARIVRALAELKTPQAAGRLLAWLKADDLRPPAEELARWGYETDGSRQDLFEEVVKAAQAFNGGQEVVDKDLLERARFRAWKGNSPEEIRQRNKDAPAARAEAVKKLVEFFEKAAK